MKFSSTVTSSRRKCRKVGASMTAMAARWALRRGLAGSPIDQKR